MNCFEYYIELATSNKMVNLKPLPIMVRVIEDRNPAKKTEYPSDGRWVDLLMKV
jgi:hypothetical protein